MKINKYEGRSRRRAAPAIFGTVVVLGMSLLLLSSGTAHAQDTWTGYDPNGLWSTATNWVGNVAPSPGDVLAFPGGVTGTRATTNDFAAGTQFNGLQFSSGLYFLNGNAINLGGNMSSTANGSGANTINLNMTLLQGIDVSVTGTYRIDVMGDISGNFGLSKSGSGMLRLGGTAKTYTGDTTISNGIIDIVADNVLPYGTGKGNVIITSGGTLQMNNMNVAVNGLSGGGTIYKTGNNTKTLSVGNGDASGTFTGAFVEGAGGPIALSKEGAGTQVVNGGQLTGALTVNGGTLQVNGTIYQTVASGKSWTVASNATLSGSGTITLQGAATVIIQDGGKLAPGNGVGTLTIGNDLVVSDAAVLQYDLGTTSDRTVVSSNLTLGGTLNITDAGGFTNGTYTLFAYGGMLSTNGTPTILAIGTTPNTNLLYLVDITTGGQVNLVVASPPVASFTASPTNGVAPLAVTFIDGSSGTITNRHWDFGNGDTTNTTATSLSYTYGTSGTYTVRLTAWAYGGSSTSTRSNYIVAVNAPHLVVVPGSLNYGSVAVGQTKNLNFSVINTGDLTLTGTAVSAAAPFAVTSPPGGGYNVGAGQTATVTVAFSPSASGTFNGSVIFASNGGNSTNAVSGVGLTPGNIAVTPDSWDFGWVAAGTTAQTSFVVINFGGTTVSNGTATVSGGPFSIVSGATFSVPGFGTANVVVQFAPVTAGGFTNSVVFATANGGAATNTVRGMGAIVPVASFSASRTNGPAPLAVTFTDTSTGMITNRFWNFGDGTTTNTTATSLSHTYGAAGTSTVSLTVSGPLGTSGQTRTNYIVIQAADTSAPTVVLTAPTTGIVSNIIAVSATATDNVAVVKVQFYREGGVLLAPAVTTPPYSVSFNTATVGDGAHCFYAQAYDAANNVGSSSTNCVTVDNHAPSVPMGLMATAVATNQINLSWAPSSDSGAGLAGYRVFRDQTQIATTAGTNYSDVGLAAGTEYGYTVAAYDNVGHVSAQSMEAWAQTFVSSGSLRSTYNGLVIQTNAPSHASSGAITVALGNMGSFAAKLNMGGAKAAFKGQFDASGNATNVVTSKGLSSLQVILHLDPANGTDQITGTVANGVFTSELLADRAVYSKANPCPWVGTYTVVLAPPEGSDPSIPQGYGFGTLIVTTTGSGKLNGELGDGTKIKGSMPVSKHGTWPLYNVLYKNQGACIGWVTFDTNDTLEATVDWFKPFLPASHYYPAGFTTNVSLVGEKYVPPSAGGPTPAGDREVTLGGGNLASNIVASVTVDSLGNVTVSSANNENLKLKLQPTTGQFSGSFTHPSLNETISFKGLVLQIESAGAGYFLGTDESGYITFEPAP